AYLRRKAGTSTLALMCGSLALASGLTGLVILLIAYATYPVSGDFAVLCAGLALITLCLLGIAGFNAAGLFKEAKAIPYVPPVADHLEALPAEEILVRGSDQPVTAPEQLLSAAGR